LERGTKNLDYLTKISRYLDGLFGASLSCDVVKKGDTEVLYFSCSSVRSSIAREDLYEKTINLVRDVAFFPYIEDDAFSKKYVDQEKENLKKNILSIKSDKKSYASLKCLENMFKDDPYGICPLGYVEDLAKINEKNLYSFYKKVVDKAVIDIFCSGDFDSEAVKAQIVESFGKNLAPRKRVYPETKICFRDSEKRLIIKGKLDMNQSKLSIGASCNAGPDRKDLYAILVMNSVFGGTYYSKLFINVREKLSLAYYVSSNIDMIKLNMTINAGIEKSKFQVAFDEISAQLEKVKNGDFSDKEIEQGKKFLITEMKSAKDSQAGIEGFYYTQLMLGNVTTIDDFIDGISSVTREEIIESAKKVMIDTVFLLEQD
jgi:predicted Zn-dependent peptidase